MRQTRFGIEPPRRSILQTSRVVPASTSYADSVDSCVPLDAQPARPKASAVKYQKVLKFFPRLSLII